MGFFAAGAGGGAVPPTDTLYDLIMADSPLYYWRHAEASGTTMVSEVGSPGKDGAYTGSFPGGHAALYSGGPTSALLNTVSRGQKTITDTLTSLTLMVVVNYPTLSSTRPIICRDAGGAGRKWQWRTNGTAVEWVKIVGGVAVTTDTGALTAGVPAIIAVTISSAGAIKMFKNGALRVSTTIAAADYGGAGDILSIGHSTGMAAGASAYFSESVLFNSVISDSRIDEYATAAGF